MRINQDVLLKIVRDTVNARSRADRGLISIYLCGSLMGDDYLLGGAADIDLVFIHSDTVATDREIVRVSDEVHLDIAHHFHRDYRQPRNLRVHPWMGPTLNGCKVLYDPQHFMDFTQASVRGQFDRADFVLQRARKQAEHARQIWAGFQSELRDGSPKEFSRYLRAVDHAVNAVAILNGPPLTERRFLLNFAQRADATGQPGLHPGLLGLLGAPKVDAGTFKAWLPAWQSAYEAAGHSQPNPRLHPARLSYYRLAMEAILAGEQPAAVLWPMLRTWTLAAAALPADAPERAAWQQALTSLGLAGPAFEERIEAMDAYLDRIEETLENWAAANGAGI